MTTLVVAAHPDDEVLGCGGTMARHAHTGESVHVLFVADGVGARHQAEFETEVAKRQDAAKRASSILGARPPSFLDFPDNRLDGVALLDVVRAVEARVSELAPERIYTHHAGDLNIDHRVVHQAVATACRPLPGSPVKAIYGFETLSSTEWQSGSGAFRPHRWVSIADWLDLKMAALRAYEDELRSFPHPRSLEAVEALARLRGSSAGLPAAECFTVIREIAS